jgi:hypothetical protein
MTKTQYKEQGDIKGDIKVPITTKGKIKKKVPAEQIN